MNFVLILQIRIAEEADLDIRASDPALWVMIEGQHGLEERSMKGVLLRPFFFALFCLCDKTRIMLYCQNYRYIIKLKLLGRHLKIESSKTCQITVFYRLCNPMRKETNKLKQACLSLFIPQIGEQMLF